MAVINNHSSGNERIEIFGLNIIQFELHIIYSCNISGNILINFVYLN